MSFTFLLAALLPSLAQAMASRQAGELVEICSATGTSMVLLKADTAPAGQDDSGKSAASSSMNCPYCAIHHGAPSLPPSPPTWTPPAALSFERPLLFLQAPRPLFAWAPALARGPPSLS